MSPEQLRNKFPWINVEGVALASYGEAHHQSTWLSFPEGSLGWKSQCPISTLKEDHFPPEQQGLPQTMLLLWPKA